MDAETFRATVAETNADELDRLGSPALLRALTGGDPDPAALLSAAAESEYAARETFREWARSAADADARATFETVAEREAEHFRRVHAAVDGTLDPAGSGPMHAYLRGRDATVDRVAGGMVGRTLVSLRTHDRFVAYFADRDPGRAALFRDLRAETADCLDDGLAALDARCEDWERAEAVAGYVIRLAVDDLDAAVEW
ncbi:MAG: rubrerythrin family protein [Haloplanus sp.]